MTENVTRGSAEARIYALAAQHGIVAERLPIDDWADKVTEFCDAVVHDPVEDLIVTLQRRGVVGDREATDLYADYLAEGRPSKEAVEARPHVRDRLAKSLAMSRELGPYGPGDHKRETDAMWGEED